MIQPITIFFVLVSAIFAATHAVAVNGYFYWVYWWFDILMHFWGGLLIALGVTTLSTFRRFDFKPTYKLVFGVAILIVTAWEVFEWMLGVTSPQTYWLDTSVDIFLGLGGALLGHWIIKRFNI